MQYSVATAPTPHLVPLADWACHRNNEGMLTMTEPQVWTLIGVFAAGLFGMLTLMSTMFVRVVRTEVGSVRTEMRSELGGIRTEMRTEIGGIRTEMRSELGSIRTEMRAEFSAVTQRIDRLDTDINALMKRSFGIDRD